MKVGPSSARPTSRSNRSVHASPRGSAPVAPRESRRGAVPWHPGRLPGSKTPRLWRGQDIASALGVPTASLFTDEVVLAEVRVSDATIEQIRREGLTACKQTAERLAGMLEPLIWREATRRPVDVSPGARPKRRRSRVEVLAGIAEANRMSAARDNDRRKRVE